MKFQVRNDYAMRQLIPDMFEEEVTDIQVRTVGDPLTHPGIGAAWYETGTNHRTIVNATPLQPKDTPWIARDIRTTHWFVEVASLDALAVLAQKYDGVLIAPSYSNHERLEIDLGHECE